MSLPTMYRNPLDRGWSRKVLEICFVAVIESVRDEAAAEHARLSGRCIVEHASLSGRDAFLTREQFDLAMVAVHPQMSRLGRAGRAYLDVKVSPFVCRVFERAVADPVDVAQRDDAFAQRRAWADNNLARSRIERDDIKRLSRSNADAAALADREVHNALMMAENPAAQIDYLARLQRVRLHALDDIRIASGRHEADVLAVVLFGDWQIEPPRQFAGLGLGHVTERKAEIVERIVRRCKQEFALVAGGVRGAHHSARAVRLPARGDVMAGRQRFGAEFAGGGEKVAKLDCAIALDARHRRFAA